MKKIIACLTVFLSAFVCQAQEYEHELFGDEYTFMEVVITKKDNYPIVFDAVTKKDSIPVDLSDPDKFAESLYSSCLYVPISDSAYIRGAQMVFGESPHTYQCSRFFNCDLFNALKKNQKETYLTLETGQTVYIRYFSVTGIFLRLGRSFLKHTVNSISLRKEDLTYIDEIILPIAVVDSTSTQIEFIPEPLPQFSGITNP